MKAKRKIEDFRMNEKLRVRLMAKIVGGKTKDAGGLCVVDNIDG